MEPHHLFSCQMWAIPAFSWGLRSIHQVIRVVGFCLALPTTAGPVITWWGIHTPSVSCLQHQQRERKQQVAGSTIRMIGIPKQLFLMLRSYISLLDIDTKLWTIYCKNIISLSGFYRWLLWSSPYRHSGYCAANKRDSLDQIRPLHSNTMICI